MLLASIIEEFPEFKSDTTYKTIFKDGPLLRVTTIILNYLAGASKLVNYIEAHISGDGRNNLAKELNDLSGVKMDRGTVGQDAITFWSIR